MSMAISDDGTVLAWGMNTSLYAINWSAPRSIDAPKNITAISTGDLHVLVLRNDGTVWAFGENRLGELGDGNNLSTSQWVQVEGLDNVKAISAGSSYNLALKDDGTVWAWGYNIHGQLGIGSIDPDGVFSPRQVQGLTNVTAVWADNFNSFALTSDGTLWGWSDNGEGELGDGTNMTRIIPERLPIENVVAVDCEQQHTLFLKDDGSVWACGLNYNGQLGIGNKTHTIYEFTCSPVQVKEISDVVAVSAGSSHSVALKRDGTVWTWGENQEGRLGIGTVSGYERLKPGEVPGLTGVTAISAGSAFTLALKDDGTVWAWGDNRAGEIGNGGVPSDIVSPIMVIGDEAVTNSALPSSEAAHGFNYVPVFGLAGLIILVGGALFLIKRK
jgi:alpha-tubulin suppressor-like RCC1 family protein